MSASYYARAVIGCEVTGKLYRQVTVPSCAHVNAPTMKFCGECGKPTAKQTIEEPVTGYDADNDKIDALGVCHTTDKKRSFVGVVVAARDWKDTAMRVDFATVQERVRSVLEPRGLWDSTSFGLWSVLYCSY